MLVHGFKEAQRLTYFLSSSSPFLAHFPSLILAPFLFPLSTPSQFDMAQMKIKENVDKTRTRDKR